MDAFPLLSGKGKDVLPPLIFVIRQEKEIWKEREIKLFLLANNMIFIVDNSKEPTKKLLYIISEVRKATGTKVNN